MASGLNQALQLCKLIDHNRAKVLLLQNVLQINSKHSTHEVVEVEEADLYPSEAASRCSLCAQISCAAAAAFPSCFKNWSSMVLLRRHPDHVTWLMM